jgi:hypothetical protein
MQENKSKLFCLSPHGRGEFFTCIDEKRKIRFPKISKHVIAGFCIGLSPATQIAVESFRRFEEERIKALLFEK